jgi:hypothetical protein
MKIDALALRGWTGNTSAAMLPVAAARATDAPPNISTRIMRPVKLHTKSLFSLSMKLSMKAPASSEKLSPVSANSL